jgi:hypothetical protein
MGPGFVSHQRGNEHEMRSGCTCGLGGCAWLEVRVRWIPRVVRKAADVDSITSNRGAAKIVMLASENGSDSDPLAWTFG